MQPKDLLGSVMESEKPACASCANLYTGEDGVMRCRISGQRAIVVCLSYRKDADRVWTDGGWCVTPNQGRGD